MAATSGSRPPRGTARHVQVSGSGWGQMSVTPSRRTRAAWTAGHQAVRPYGHEVWTPRVMDSTWAHTGTAIRNEHTAKAARIATRYRVSGRVEGETHESFDRRGRGGRRPAGRLSAHWQRHHPAGEQLPERS